MPLSRWAQRSARVVALGAAALGLGPRTRPPAPAPAATAPAADDGADDVALALRAATDLIDTADAADADATATATATAGVVNAADAVGRLTAEGARPAAPGRIAADPSPAAPRP